MLKITLIDRSFYFKGLLLLIRKDALVTAPETRIIMQLGKTLGFEAGFCQNAIDEILINEHIVDKPPVFSNPEIARLFLRDGITVSICDQDIHPKELEWMQAVAQANQLEFEAIHDQWKSDHQAGLLNHLEAQSLAV